MVIEQKITENYGLYHGDCIEVLKDLPENSIGYSIFSPPFMDLYVYSDNDRDLGNCKDKNDFSKHFEFFIKEIYRVIKKGRNVSIHCTNIPLMKEKDGYIGLRDFRGEIIKKMVDAGFIFHSEVTIWKDPLIEATRTKALGLMHKQLCKDSAMCRNGMPDYIITFRKLGENTEFIKHEFGLGDDFEYFGSNGSDIPRSGDKKSHYIWQKYASPVWFDIRQTRTLNAVEARNENDEKHICPLQLDTIGRCLVLWSNSGDTVLDPFNGIASTGFQAIQMGRKYIGIELKKDYYNIALKNLEKAEFNGVRIKEQELF